MAVLSTSYDVESGVKTTFKTGISSSATSGLILRRALVITQGVLLINRGASTQEWISFGGTSVAGSETTLTDVVRGLVLSGNSYTGSATRAYAHGSAETVELIDYHILLNLKANIDRTNTWTADQLFNSTVKLTFGNSNNWIRFDGVSDIEFKSSAQAARTLSQLASASGSNDKIKVTSNDTTEAYLDTKITAGSGLVRTVTNPGANEGYTLDINLEASTPTLQISSDQLGLKMKSGYGLKVDASGVYVDGSELTGLPATDITYAQLIGETSTANDVIFINGDGYAKKAQSDVLTDHFSFMGVLKQSGVLDETKNIAVVGVPVTINSLSASLDSAKTFDGVTQSTSSTNVAVYGVNRYAQTVTIPTGQTNIKNYIANLTKNGTPAGTYSCAVYATSGGVPTGAALGTATLGVASMASGDNTFVFSSPVAVTAGTVYAIAIFNAGATVTDNYAWNYSVANPYSGGQWCSSVDSGSTWAGNASNDFRFKIQYKGLPSTDVYLGDTAGTPAIVPGTYFKKIGKLLSATKLLMSESAPSIYATYTWSASSVDTTVDTEISLGFRPRALIAIAHIGVGDSIGFWHHGLSGGVFWGHNYSNGSTETQPQGAGYIAQGSSSGGAVNDYTRLLVQATSADSITIRRDMNDDAADAPGGTIYLMILG